jgi:hypothetical protein
MHYPMKLNGLGWFHPLLGSIRNDTEVQQLVFLRGMCFPLTIEQLKKFLYHMELNFRTACVIMRVLLTTCIAQTPCLPICSHRLHFVIS